MGCVPFHIEFQLIDSTCCGIPQSRLRRASSHRPGALRAVPAANFARRLSTTRYFPDPPGIGGLSAELIHYSLFTIHLKSPVSLLRW